MWTGPGISSTAARTGWTESCRPRRCTDCTSLVTKNLSAHGLRKAGATRLAEHGCTDHEIMAWGGWSSLKEVQRYTNAANRKRLALQAAAKLKAGTEVANLETRLANQEKKP